MNFRRILFLVVALMSLGSAWSNAQPRGDWRYDRRPEGRRVATVTFFEHADFRGASLTLAAGDSIINLDRARFENGSRINDRISSIRVDGPVEVIAYEHAGFQGRALVVRGDIRNLDWIAGRWNDTISSLQIRPLGRR